MLEQSWCALACRRPLSVRSFHLYTTRLQEGSLLGASIALSRVCGERLRDVLDRFNSCSRGNRIATARPESPSRRTASVSPASSVQLLSDTTQQQLSQWLEYSHGTAMRSTSPAKAAAPVVASPHLAGAAVALLASPESLAVSSPSTSPSTASPGSSVGGGPISEGQVALGAAAAAAPTAAAAAAAGDMLVQSLLTSQLHPLHLSMQVGCEWRWDGYPSLAS
jgi:hypothetical protein